MRTAEDWVHGPVGDPRKCLCRQCEFARAIQRDALQADSVEATAVEKENERKDREYAALYQRLKEVEKERDHLSTTIHEQQFGKYGLSELRAELSQLRTAYKQVLDKLKQAQHEAKCEYQNKYGKECFLTRFDDVLSTPLAIAMMKGSQ